jgi:hypothetical protein
MRNGINAKGGERSAYLEAGGTYYEQRILPNLLHCELHFLCNLYFRGLNFVNLQIQLLTLIYIIINNIMVCRFLKESFQRKISIIV